ncbi:hypothetical protein VTL71DRAFT_10338 [Oculimacula yallundae]|uniref:Uncharacterized protein n=1 Tax=Oculimacula yallundae TaxID=86028 RepID=A0ABR4CSQ4_9HELO
MPPLVFDT